VESSSSIKRQKIALTGELLAKEFLVQKGYQILFHRFWTRFGEIDLVAQKKDCISIVEVKTTGNPEAEPLENITSDKIQRLFRASQILFRSWRGAPKKYQVKFIGVAVKLIKPRPQIEWVDLVPY
jgi:putative endonuclease